MTRFARVVLGALLMCLSAALWVPVARADDGDRITRLDVTYGINADGSIDVDYEIDYHFGSPNRHGITFSIATGEVARDDAAMAATYGVTDVQVSDPAGQSLPFTSERQSNSVSERSSLDLRIGDPDKTVEGTEASYRVRWHGTGMLRLVEGRPLFDWNVTSPDVPPIDRYRVRIATPAAVDTPLCRGAATCEGTHQQGKGFEFQGTEVAEGKQLSVSVRLPKGSVAVKPQLAPRQGYGPLIIAGANQTTLDAQGIADVTETYQVVGGSSGDLSHWLPSRTYLDDRQDMLYEVSDFAASWDGEPLTWSTSESDTPGISSQTTYRTLHTPPGSGRHTMKVTYRVRGAVTVSGDTASFHWPTLGWHMDYEYSPGTRMVVDYTMPGAVSRASCDGWQLTDAKGNKAQGAGVHGKRVHCVLSGANANTPGVEFAASAVPGVQPILAPSLRRQHQVRTWWAWAASALSVPLGLVLPRLGRLRTRRHQRFAGVPVGVVAEPGTPTVVDHVTDIPVRFTPPDAPMATIGSLVDGVDPARVLAATLAKMHLAGHVSVSTDPLRITRTDKRPTDALELDLLGRASNAGDSATGRRSIAKMVDIVTREFEGPASQAVLVPGSRRKPVLAVLLVALAGAVALVALALLLMGRGWGGIVIFGLLGGWAGLALGAWRVLRAPARGVRNGMGTALHDQALGFREYLSTAEGDQLRFEEDEDQFSRYLPWAILFGVADDWAKACREAAAAGLPSGFSVESWSGLSDWSGSASGALDRAANAHAAASRSSSSSGGGSWSSGSSSSSSSSSSGGGGGGVSIGSW